MLTIKKRGGGRVDIALDGALDSDTMRAGLDDLIEKTRGVTNGRMLYTITNFEFPSLGAIGVEVTRLPELFRLVNDFDRCAVLCDLAWVRTVSELEGRLFPGLEIKAFGLGHADLAEAWLAEGEQESAA